MSSVIALPSLAADVAVSHDLVSTKQEYDRLIAAAHARMMVDPRTAAILAKSAEQASSSISGPDKGIAAATAQWLQGEAYVRLNEADKAAPLIDGAISLAAKGGRPTKLYGDLLLSKGGLKTAQADVAGALTAYQHAYEVFRRIGETRSQAIAIVLIGVLYEEANDDDHALKYYARSLDIYKGDLPTSFCAYTNRGVAFLELHRIADAGAEFRKALDIARRLKSGPLEAQTLRNIARVKLLSGQPIEADRSIALGIVASNNEETASAQKHFLVLSAWSARLRNHLPLAERLITRALLHVDRDAPTLDVREAHQVAYDIFKQAGNQSQALVHLEALKALDDKTSKLAASASTALAAARFDFASQALNIEKLKRAALQRNVTDAKLRAQTQQTIFGGAAVATLVIMALLAIGLVTLRRSRNQVRAANVDLGNTNARLAEALAAKTEFLATTSHEIRTPLNGILGMTQVMLADRSLAADLRDRLSVVHGAGVTMRALVDDILDVAKMETGNLTLEDVSFDLVATLREVAELWQEQARAKGLRFVLDLSGCPDHVMGDSARVRQIAFNLLSNALKFTATGEIRLSATTRDAVLVIAVRDSGIGIPADKLEVIFESFRQVDAGTTRKFGGSGLGLAICRNLAHAMGGTVAVSSAIGAGSTFALELPLRIAAAPASVAQRPTIANALLILDRNPISRSMLRAILEPRAGTVVLAGSVAEAMARIAEGGVAQMLIDDSAIKAEADPESALATLGASGVRATLLWAGLDDAQRARLSVAAIDQLVAKPIAGVALAGLLFDSAPPDRHSLFDSAIRAA